MELAVSTIDVITVLSNMLLSIGHLLYVVIVSLQHVQVLHQLVRHFLEVPFGL